MNSQLPRVALLSCILALPTGVSGQVPSAQSSKSIPVNGVPAPKENPLNRFKSFSANVSGGIAQDHDRKIYRSGNLMRLDFDGSYRVTDLNTLQMWGVGGDRCIEFDRPDAGTFPFSAYQDFNAERSPATEQERIGGHVCKVEHVTLTPPDDRPLVVKMKLWEAEDLDGFPIRIEVESAGHTLTSTYTNVSLKTPEPKLFDHPATCAPGAQPGQDGGIGTGPPGQKQNPSPK